MIVQIGKFAFINPKGGTGLSDWDHNERFAGAVTVRVADGFFDYETGWRFIAESADPALDAYLDRNANPDDRRIFFDDSAVVDSQQVAELIARFEGGCA